MEFNQSEPHVMHIDINSCFATIEQQANPFLRRKPTVVAAYAENYGCILASSREAKMLGIKTGMRVREARIIYPNLFVLPPDPPKYRAVHLALRKIVSRYTYDFSPRSIDEFVLNLSGFPILRTKSMSEVGMEIKKRIRDEVGEWITVSIGISVNRFLAKTGASLHKPDGLDEINKDNFLDIYSTLALTDLCGINKRNKIRLNRFGIYNVTQFYDSDIANLRSAFGGIVGQYWYLRLRGYEVDNAPIKRRTFGNSYVLPKALELFQAFPVIMKLTEKMSFRARKAGYLVGGVHVFLSFYDYSHWHMGRKLHEPIYATSDIYQAIIKLIKLCPIKKKIKHIAVSSFDLKKEEHGQLFLFEEQTKKRKLTYAIDCLNKKFGAFSIYASRMAYTQEHIPDSIAFGQAGSILET